MLRKLFVIVAVVLLAPLLVAMIPLAMALIVAIGVYRWARLRWNCVRSGQWMFLVCSPRHDWHEFLAHNVIPWLPAPVIAVWTVSHGGAKRVAPANVLSAGATLAKPYLAQVRGIGVRVLSVHDELRPYKTHAKAAAEAQIESQQVIGHAYDRLVRQR